MSIVVDYEELRRMAAVWESAAKSLAKQAFSVADLAADPAVFADAVFDPLGAARAERAILAAAAPPQGLFALSARLAADAIALDAVVVKEQAIDNFPLRELARFDEWLATAAFRFPFAPGQTLREGRDAASRLGSAGLGYLSPWAEPLLAAIAPSAQFRLDVALRRPLSVDPVFGAPLSLVGAVAPEGPGDISMSKDRPAWSGVAPNSIADAMRRVSDLEHLPHASLAIERVAGADGMWRYVIELPGMRHMGEAADPQDLTGAIAAMALPATAYTRCVVKALDAVGAPRGAPVMLVGHSEGGIVAMDLAADPAFNGGRVTVTHVVTAGAPISSKQVTPGSGTKVFSVENVNDIVTHLDGVDSAADPQTADRLTYQFSEDRHDIVGTHDASMYAERMAALADSPNPLLREFDAGVRPYTRGATTTTVFTLADAPAG